MANLSTQEMLFKKFGDAAIPLETFIENYGKRYKQKGENTRRKFLQTLNITPVKVSNGQYIVYIKDIANWMDSGLPLRK